MKKAAILLTVLLGAVPFSVAQTLRVATVNVWSGLDYNGTWSMGDYEGDSVRELRFKILVKEIRSRSIDVVALQEVNPTRAFSKRLAKELGFDEIHQVCNGGMKLLGLGIPTNLTEGIAILAHPRLQLREREVFKIQGGFGIYGDIATIHFTESNFALVGTIKVEDRPIVVTNVHLKATLPPRMADTLEAWHRTGRLTSKSYSKLTEELKDKAAEREELFRSFLDKFHDRYAETPVILLGDLNAEPSSPEVRLLVKEWKYRDACGLAGDDCDTWSASRNTNTRFSAELKLARSEKKGEYDLLASAYDLNDRRIDYVFLNRFFDSSAVSNAGIFLDQPKDGLFASDHFGVLAEIRPAGLLRSVPPVSPHFAPVANSSIEGFPILSYDTDVGFGYGAKGFFLNQLGWNESFDVTLFNSVKIERWYRFVFSVPDFELRQGKIYPLALDLTVDYDKYLKANFFGLGNSSPASAKETYVRDPLEMSLIASRGIQPTLAAQVGLKLKTVRNSGFVDTSLALRTPPAWNTGRSTALSLLANVRLDTRDSYINPHRGAVLQGEVEVSGAGSNFSMFRTALTAQYFTVLFYPTTVFAARLSAQAVSGSDLPFWTMTSLGGNNTLRGYPMDRFIDRSGVLMNAEFRFPLYRRLKGVLFFDAGRVWNLFSELNLTSFHSNPGIGLRFVMDTFVVRLDVGFSSETTGFYFNFGHAF